MIASIAMLIVLHHVPAAVFLNQLATTQVTRRRVANGALFQKDLSLSLRIGIGLAFDFNLVTSHHIKDVLRSIKNPPPIHSIPGIWITREVSACALSLSTAAQDW